MGTGSLVGEPRPPLGPHPQLSPHVPTKSQVPPPAGCPPSTPGPARGRLTGYLAFPGSPHQPLGPEHSLPGSVLPMGGYLAPCGVVPGAFWGCQLGARTPLLCPSLRHLQACDPDPLCLALALGKRQPQSLRGARGTGGRSWAGIWMSPEVAGGCKSQCKVRVGLQQHKCRHSHWEFQVSTWEPSTPSTELF